MENENENRVTTSGKKKASLDTCESCVLFYKSIGYCGRRRDGIIKYIKRPQFTSCVGHRDIPTPSHLITSMEVEQEQD
jgi:hypothetical protein